MVSTHCVCVRFSQMLYEARIFIVLTLWSVRRPNSQFSLLFGHNSREVSKKKRRNFKTKVMRYKIMHSKRLELCKINRFALSVSGALDNKIDQKNCLVNYGIMSTTYLNS